MAKTIIANWKMKLSVEESLVLASSINIGLEKIKKNNKIVICPDYISLPLISLSLNNHQFFLGAQDSSTQIKAAATGEVSPANLKEVGANYIIIGHSERRVGQLEANTVLNLKIKTALEVGLGVVLCLGENLSQRNKGETKKVILKQLKESLRGVKIGKGNELLIAYEPVWAIGSGQAMLAPEANKISGIIKTEAEKILKKKVKILYGGSVDLENAKEFLKQKNISGLLVGAASLKKDDFLAICSI